MEKKSRGKTLLTLFLTFFKIGSFTFGGGYAMLALLENEFVQKKKWIKSEDFLDMIAIAESTPGPVAVNSATYIGYKTAGVLGSVLSTLAVVIPSFTIIFIISLFFDRFISLKWVAYAFSGIKACVIYLILSAGIKTLKSLKKTVFNYTVTILVFAVMITLGFFSVSFSSIYIILACGLTGLAFYSIIDHKKGGKGK